MVPVNQVILGGDPLLGSSMLGNNIEEQLQLLDRYRQNLENAKNMKQQIQQAPQRLIWDEIDLELQPMSDEQKSVLFQNEEYVETYTRIQGLVNAEILNLVKAKIESTQEGNELLRNQLKILRKLKGKIIEDTNREMEMFRRFKEFSKHNPEMTYDEFIKNNIG
jgi:hypothetical protein